MKTRAYLLTIALVACMTLLACHATAVRPTEAIYGSNIVASTVDAFCIGTFGVKHEMQWKQTSDENGLYNTPMAAGESRADYTYREATLGYEGTATYLKDFSMNGGNVQAGVDNLNVNHVIDFENSPNSNGILIFDEMARMDLWGAATNQTDTMCVFGAAGSGANAYRGSVTVGSQMRVREVSATMGVGSSAISDNPNAPVNLRYTFDAEGIATDPDDNLAEGTARVYSIVDMHIGNDNTSSPARTPMTAHIQDRQSQWVDGFFDFATTFEYGS